MLGTCEESLHYKNLTRIIMGGPCADAYELCCYLSADFWQILFEYCCC